jgi:hypothetical protein
VRLIVNYENGRRNQIRPQVLARCNEVGGRHARPGTKGVREQGAFLGRGFGVVQAGDETDRESG